MGGVQARKLGQRFSSEIINELEKLKWWDLEYEIIKEDINLFKTNINEKNIAEIIKELQQ